WSEVSGIGSAGELLARQAGQEQQRAAWPVVRGDVAGVPVRIATDKDGAGDRLATDSSDVVLDPTVLVAIGSGEVELLAVIQRAEGTHDGPDGLGAFGCTIKQRPLYGDIFGQVVQPRRVVVGEPPSGITAPQIRGCGFPLESWRVADS